MRLPSVLTTSGSSTPASWSLVPEKESAPLEPPPVVVVGAAATGAASFVPPAAGVGAMAGASDTAVPACARNGTPVVPPVRAASRRP